MTTNISLPRGEIIQQMDGVYELFPVAPDQKTLLAIIKTCLSEWEHIRIGPLIPGAVWESKSALPDVARHRRTGRAELYRRLNPDSQLTSWGFRMFNGAGDQQVTILLPNPHLDGDQNYVDEPNWSRLYLWDRLTHEFLGRGQDPWDRSAPNFYHG